MRDQPADSASAVKAASQTPSLSSKTNSSNECEAQFDLPLSMHQLMSCTVQQDLPQQHNTRQAKQCSEMLCDRMRQYFCTRGMFRACICVSSLTRHLLLCIAVALFDAAVNGKRAREHEECKS